MTDERKALYEAIEKERNSKLLVYITGDKAGWETQIANDATDYITEHLDKIGVVPKISLFLFTNGGNTLAGWNIVNLIRQFCDDFEIIVPGKARSTGTLMCLGANRIIMTKQATLGPIDPSVNTPLNPTIPNAGPQARVPVSVEAIKGFLELAKHELNLKDERALADIFNVLADKVHPLVLGEVYRAIGQIQMLARKLLVNQVTDEEKIKLCEIVTEAKADYIKTSTGFGTYGATMEDIMLFKEHIGSDVKMKAAGGIRTKEDMEGYLNAGCDRIGTSGASSL